MSKWCVGIDLGGTFIKFCLLSADHKPTRIFQLPTPSDRGGQGVADQMIAGAQQAMKEAGAKVRDIVGVGIGSPGPMSMARGVVFRTPNLPMLEGFPLRDAVSKAMGVPVALENDANAAAYGEYLCGDGSRRGDMVFLTLGTGVGSGIIVNGKLLHGDHEIGGEIGHMILEPDGELCGCGQRGCLERYCSATFLAEYARRLIEQNGRKSRLQDVLKAKGDIDAKDISDACRDGDALAAEVWDRAARYLAIGCVNICRIFDPDEIVLGGGLTKAGDELLAPVQRHVAKLHWSLTMPATKISIARLGNDAGAIGAAGVAWSAFARPKDKH
jgi:glucokinase